MKQKRRPIRQKVLRMMLLISVLAMQSVGLVAVVSMLYLRKQSTKALTSQTTQNLLNIAQDKAAVVNTEFNLYSALVSLLADTIHAGYLREDAVSPSLVQQLPASTAADTFLHVLLARDSVSLATIQHEKSFFRGLQPLFSSAMQEHSTVISAIYAATKNGLMLSYDSQLHDGNTQPDYYDFLHEEWFAQGMRHTDAYFTGLHISGVGRYRRMSITCAAPFFDAQNAFAGVVAMDLVINDLYDAIVSLPFGEDVQSFLFDAYGRLVSPSLTDSSMSIFTAFDLDIISARQSLVENDGVLCSTGGVYYAFDTISAIGWKFCIRVPKEVLLLPVRAVDKSIISMFMIFILLFVATLICVFVGAHRLSERLTRPLVQLRRDVKKISGGNLKYDAKVYENDEIGDLANGVNQMAVSLRRYVEYVTTVAAENERIHAELDVATKIQAYMLPSQFPAFPERKDFDIYATMTPAKEVGGDFYDFFLIDSDHLAIVMGDASGKGVPAALFMVNAKTLIKNMAFSGIGGTSPSLILAQVNNQLYELNEGSFFITVWLGILELSTGVFTATNAGHECPAVRRADGKFELIKNDHCPPLAAMDDLIFDEVEMLFKAGDSLCLYTDGVVEAKNEKHEEFGSENLLAALNEAPEATAETQLQSIKAAIDRFVGKAPQYDDITLLALDYHGTPSAV